MNTRTEGKSLVCTDTETVRGAVQSGNTLVESTIRVSGEWSVDIPKLVGAVGEDPALSPAEKEFTLNTTKDDNQFRVYVEVRGPMQRFLGKRIYDNFEPTELRVNTESSSGKRMKPHHFSGGTITGVKGYIPIGATKIKSGSRSTSALAEAVSNEVPEPDEEDRRNDGADNGTDDTVEQNSESQQQNDDPPEDDNSSVTYQPALNW
jgi:hypothetical protein